MSLFRWSGEHQIITRFIIEMQAIEREWCSKSHLLQGSYAHVVTHSLPVLHATPPSAREHEMNFQIHTSISIWISTPADSILIANPLP